jgi:hypothetical protein
MAGNARWHHLACANFYSFDVPAPLQVERGCRVSDPENIAWGEVVKTIPAIFFASMKISLPPFLLKEKVEPKIQCEIDAATELY